MFHIGIAYIAANEICFLICGSVLIFKAYAAHKSVNFSGQHDRLEWLCQVIITTQSQAVVVVGICVLRCKQDHRHL